jgi:arylsulfatase A-like enzyme
MSIATIRSALACAAATAAALLALGAARAEAPPARAPAAPARPAASTPAPARPNFIFIQAEAQGWSSTSVDMDGQPPSTARPAGLTPNLEKLAADGVRMSDFYASCPRCTPSRASWVTGISPAKLHMTYQSEGGRDAQTQEQYRLLRMLTPTPLQDLPEGVRTTGGWLHDLGYASAHFGKWHVGRQAPDRVGFDRSDGANSNQGPERGVAPNPTQAVAITDRGIEFMREQVKAGKPFYLQLSHYGFGSEEEATPQALAAAKELVPGVEGKPLAAIAGARDVDTQVGRVLAAVRELGIADRTYIFYSADHGAQGGGSRAPSNPPFSGGKGSVSEGGIRIPFIACGPGIPAGKVVEVRATNMDFLPTLLELAGAPTKAPPDPDAVGVIEGGSLAAVLRSGATRVERPHEGIVIHFPHYDLGNGGPATAIYLGPWKLVRNDDQRTLRLYEVARDPAEQRDRAAEQPEVVRDLVARMDAYLAAVKAPLARVNDAPGAGTGEPPQRHGGKDGGGKEGGKGGKGGGGKGSGKKGNGGSGDAK